MSFSHKEYILFDVAQFVVYFLRILFKYYSYNGYSNNGFNFNYNKEYIIIPMLVLRHLFDYKKILTDILLFMLFFTIPLSYRFLLSITFLFAVPFP